MTNVVCVSGVDLLMDYLEGLVPDDVRAALDAHVRGCERCMAFIESYRAAPATLREVTAAAMPADLQSSLLAALRARLREPS
jgi:anti-sigma factor RsiW